MGGSTLVLDLRRNSPALNVAGNQQVFGPILSGLVKSTLMLCLSSLGLVSCSGGPDVPTPVRASYGGGIQSGSLERSHPQYRQNSSRSSIYPRSASRIPLGGGVRKTGNPYKILGRWYTPKHQPNYNKIGVASWYGRKFHGKKTANGEVFDMNNLTAAHPTLPLPSYVRVTNLSNRRTLILRLNDRGPYAHNRIMDLSRKAAELLDTKSKGTERVSVQYLGPAPLDGNLSREEAHLARQPWFRSPYRRANAKSSWINRFSLGAPQK